MVSKLIWSSTRKDKPSGYEYIQVITEDENYANNPMRLIVDIDFRSQFELARPTQHYKELTDSLPVFLLGLRTNFAR
ncbi:hypothetical protein Lalb_Chr00c34g0408471 [Lupinus albus]|uniref:Uncharacterized protein n=1 Tax=Lupinus albus TaxID=3870 RepID=A0A6A4NC64_LUPAL|nr:hypothetical protein Lalb_Chr00c34g0408471 [Lupinus albus]